LGILSLVAKAKCFIRLRRFYHPGTDQSGVTATGNVVMGYGKAGSLASRSSFSSLSKHNRFKIAFHQVFRADTTFSFELGLFSFTAIIDDLWSPFFLS
jgi:hypothetical protein